MATLSIVALLLPPEWITLASVETFELFWHVFGFFLIRVFLHVGFVKVAFHFERRIFLYFLVANFLLLLNLFVCVFTSNVCAWQGCDVRGVEVIMLETLPGNALLLVVFLSLLLVSCFAGVQARIWSGKSWNLRLEVAFSWERFAQISPGLLTLLINGHFILIGPETIKACLVCSSEIPIWPQQFWRVLSGSSCSHSFRNSDWIWWPNKVISSCYTFLSGLSKFFSFFFWSQDLAHHRTNLVVLSIDWSVLCCRIHSLAFFNNPMHRISPLTPCMRLWYIPIETFRPRRANNCRLLVSVPSSVDEVILYSNLG